MVYLIGISNFGCLDLTSRIINKVVTSDVLVGGERHLSYFPQFKGEKIVLKSNITSTIAEIAKLNKNQNISVIASGDPMFFGIGELLLKYIEKKEVLILPHISSIQYAFAKLGEKWQDATFLSVHGRDIYGIANKLSKLNKVAILTDKNNTPTKIAKHLIQFNQTDFEVFLCEEMSYEDGKITKYENITELATQTSFAELNLLILKRKSSKNQLKKQYLNDDDFEQADNTKKMITKKEVRLLSIAELNINEDSIIWDIGASTGSIAIECAKIAVNGKAYAIETNPKAIPAIQKNIERFSTDNIKIIHGTAPEALEQCQETPDSIFIGGSKGNLKDIIEYSNERIAANGNIVVNAIALENIHTAYETMKELNLNPDVKLVSISRGKNIADKLLCIANNPIYIISGKKRGYNEG
jgi:precorrin-6Y C5,15-methyltransferase (decarboxylating)